MTDTTLGAARADYYCIHGFGDDGGDALDWVPVKLWKLTIKIPNTDGRRRAVKIHDLHHVVTGYRTDLRGESEIASWELATGCLNMSAALVLNLLGLALGLVIAPARMARAWARGRASRNLYRHPQLDALLGEEVATVRAQLGLVAAPPRARARDVAAILLVGLPTLAITLAALAAPLVGLYAAASAIAG